MTAPRSTTWQWRKAEEVAITLVSPHDLKEGDRVLLREGATVSNGRQGWATVITIRPRARKRITVKMRFNPKHFEIFDVSIDDIAAVKW